MTTILSPRTAGPVIDLGRGRFRKQLLKVGSVLYHGNGEPQRLDFTPAYLRQLVDSFQAGAFDEVPFQLADAQNRHNEDPTRCRGAITDLQFTGDGVDAIVDLDDNGAQMVRDNPKLGVSARILQDHQRSDGKRWPAVVRHVLGTLDPVITSMRPWEELAGADLAYTDRDVIDLSNSVYTPSHAALMAAWEKQFAR